MADVSRNIITCVFAATLPAGPHHDDRRPAPAPPGATGRCRQRKIPPLSGVVSWKGVMLGPAPRESETTWSGLSRMPDVEGLRTFAHPIEFESVSLTHHA